MMVNELAEIIKGRRSIRRWQKKDVPEELLRKAIELATWAPNGGNFQAWRFTAVKNREVITRMADAVQSVVDKMASWPEASPWEEAIRRSQRNASFFKDASACVAAFAGKFESPLDKVLIARLSADDQAERIYSFRRFAPTAIQSVAAAVMTLLLVFQSMGLGAVWLAAPPGGQERD